VKEQANSEPVAHVPSETADADAAGHDTVTEREEAQEETQAGDKGAVDRDRRNESPSEAGTAHDGADTETKRIPTRGDEPFEKWEREEMEKLLGQVRGHLGESIRPSARARRELRARVSHLSHEVPRGRGCVEQLPVQRGPASPTARIRRADADCPTGSCRCRSTTEVGYAVLRERIVQQHVR
jgi:hypothetical protein